MTQPPEGCFSAQEIADMFGVSRGLVYKRAHLAGLMAFPKSMTIDQLRDAIGPRQRKQVVKEYTCQACGEKKTMGPGPLRKHCPECVPNGPSQMRMVKFGITEQQFQVLWQKQEGRCAICDKKLVLRRADDQQSFANVDHDHQTQRIRGILCVRCNHRLAVLDDTEWCAKAQDYLAGQENEDAA